MLYLKLLEKQEKAKPKTSRRRKIIKIEAKINELETKKAIQRINGTKSWFFEKNTEVDKHLANLTKMRGKRPNSVKSKMKKGR
jgi:hypothetical protein